MDPRSWFQDLTPYFIYTLFVATLGPLLFGFHLSELNAPEDVIRCKKDSIVSASVGLPQCMKMDPTQWGVVGSMYTLGGLIGALSAGPLAGNHGRYRTMQLTTIFFALGPVLEALSPNIGVLAFGRLLSGVGAGAAVVVVPIYISEIAPPAEKGFFGAFTQIMCNVGILLTQLLGYFLSHGQYWRLILAIGGCIGVGQSFGLLLTVESPRFLAEQGETSKARRILRKLRGEKADIDTEISSWGIDSTEETSDEEQTLLRNEDRDINVADAATTKRSQDKEDALSIIQVFKHPDYSKAAFAVIMVMLAQQLSGINSIVMYGVSLLADLLESNSALLNLAVSALNIVVTAGCAPLADKLGRKTCLLYSLAGMGTSSLLLAVGIMRSISVLSAIAVLLFVSSFAVGLGPVPFILSSELVGADAVGATQSIALAANWIATFLVAQFFPLASAVLHGKVYFIFAALSAFFFLFISWYVPETKGKKTPDEVWGRERRHASPALPPLASPQPSSPTREDGFELPASSTHDSPNRNVQKKNAIANRAIQQHHGLPPSLISPAFTPPATPGLTTPSHPRPPRSVPVDTSKSPDTPAPELVQTLPIVECEVRARIPTTTGHEMWLHVYRNNVDTKEHLAIVFGNQIRSRSLDAERPGETELDRMTRGAYVGRLYPGRTSSRVEQLKRAELGGGLKPKSATAAAAAKSDLAVVLEKQQDGSLVPSSSASSDSGEVQQASNLDLPLVRIHSECYTGETVWSARCDCGEQLDEAARLMADPRLSPTGGAIIYLRQEGRGIGLGEKLKAYNLQDLGNDTYEANIMLRHPADARSYGLATAMLMDLGLEGEAGIRLLTNNPDKVRAVEGPNREVVVRERVAMVPLAWKTGGKQGINSEEVEKYLSTKIEKFKHMLSSQR
ncbi:hypothetical protein BU24DRAFT_347930 [Aaosphaeria arxii CBS 175.79]|uniref:Major facilitator superfamily (MFS) profile domain-containing protein n=1 Tax=Aaosphaeria arxii CBS 175.79 TaxID=1450172 RepID=A0A6A5XR56_9PLEO|nr:uncharacterized protein BU24DRAFT_347930 [Aaosphaeria arxii CBS 175.79]KAF2014784.1 hypothetical protein BU24DRAFT_347930 [Aaosphaeria arxii CBS 175.79]